MVKCIHTLRIHTKPPTNKYLLLAMTTALKHKKDYVWKTDPHPIHKSLRIKGGYSASMCLENSRTRD